MQQGMYVPKGMFVMTREILSWIVNEIKDCSLNIWAVCTVYCIVLSCVIDILLCLDVVWKNDFDIVLVLLRAFLRQDVQSAMQRYKA